MPKIDRKSNSHIFTTSLANDYNLTVELGVNSNNSGSQIDILLEDTKSREQFGNNFSREGTQYSLCKSRFNF